MSIFFSIELIYNSKLFLGGFGVFHFFSSAGASLNPFRVDIFHAVKQIEVKSEKMVENGIHA